MIKSKELDKLLLVLCPPKFFSNRSAELRWGAKTQIEKWVEEEKEAVRQEMRGQL